MTIAAPRVCGARAMWMRPPTTLAEPRFFCALHSLAGDVPVPDDALFRRVTVTLEVMLCAVSSNPGVAHAEAVEQLERVIAGAGGVVNLHACRSQLGRWAPQPAVGPQKPGRPTR